MTGIPAPESLPWMHSVDAKIVRAGEHLEVLTKDIHDYLRAAMESRMMTR